MWPFSRTRPEPFTDGDLREYVMDDGSRLFAELWETQPIDFVHAHAQKLQGAEVHTFPIETPDATLSLTFRYKGFAFTVSPGMGDYRFFVNDPGCDNDTLLVVARHFNQLLRPVTSTWHVFFRRG
jgi:hypothetical protein